MTHHEAVATECLAYATHRGANWARSHASPAAHALTWYACTSCQCWHIARTFTLKLRRWLQVRPVARHTCRRFRIHGRDVGCPYECNTYAHAAGFHSSVRRPTISAAPSRRACCVWWDVYHVNQRLQPARVLCYAARCGLCLYKPYQSMRVCPLVRVVPVIWLAAAVRCSALLRPDPTT